MMNHRTRALVGLLCIAGLASGQLNQNYRPEFFSPGQGFQSVSAQISSSNVQQFKRQAPGGGGAGGADVIPHDQKKQTTFWWVAPDTPFKATKIGGGVQEPPGTGGDGDDGAAGAGGAVAGAVAGGAAGGTVSQTAFQASAARTTGGQAGQVFGAGGATTSIQSSTASRTIGTQTQGFGGAAGVATGGAAGTLGTTRSSISKSSTSSTFGTQGGVVQPAVIAGSTRTSTSTSNTQVNTGTIQPGVGAGGVRTSTIIRQSKTQSSTGVAPVPVPAPPPPTTSIQSTTTGVRTDTITSNINRPVPPTTVGINTQTNVDTQRTIQTNLYPGQPAQPGSTSTASVVGTSTRTTDLTPNNFGGNTVTKTQERTDGGITSKVITTGTITRPFFKQTTSTSGYNYPVPETIPCYEPNKICAPNQYCNDGFVDESQLNLFNTNNQLKPLRPLGSGSSQPANSTGVNYCYRNRSHLRCAPTSGGPATVVGTFEPPGPRDGKSKSFGDGLRVRAARKGKPDVPLGINLTSALDDLPHTAPENCNSATEQCCRIRATPATRCPDDSYVCVSPDLCNNGLLNFDAQNAISTRQPTLEKGAYGSPKRFGRRLQTALPCAGSDFSPRRTASA
uniref:Uncharacterized protein n=1 Tax=Anopheles maculatus TaxID=74869 RepID=A0A182SV50_9DIPT